MLQLHCKFWYCHKMSSVVNCRRLFVTRVYCDKTAEARIMQFSLKYTHCLTSLPGKFGYEIRRESPWSGGLKLGWGGFWLRDAITQKRCEIELRWQLITNRKSYMGFRLQQKLITLNVNSLPCALSSELCVFWPNGCGYNYGFTLWNSTVPQLSAHWVWLRN